jgi:hypothetical protein
VNNKNIMNSTNGTELILDKINKKLYEKYLELCSYGENKVENKLSDKEAEVYNGNTKNVNDQRDSKTVYHFLFIDKETILKEYFSDPSIHTNHKEKDVSVLNKEEELNLEGYHVTGDGIYRKDDDGWVVRDANMEDKKKQHQQKNELEKKPSHSILLPNNLEDFNQTKNKDTSFNLDLSLSLSRPYSIIRKNSYDSIVINKDKPLELGEFLDNLNLQNNVDNFRRATSKSVYPQSSFKESDKNLRNNKLAFLDKQDSGVLSNRATFAKSFKTTYKGDYIEKIRIKSGRSKATYNYDELDENDYSSPKNKLKHDPELEDKSIALDKVEVSKNIMYLEPSVSKQNEYESDI